MFGFLKWPLRGSRDNKTTKKTGYANKLPHTQNQIDMITEMSNYYNAKDRLLQTLLTMVNYTQGIALWVKDSNDRYIFADQGLRRTIFNGRDISEINGKTDNEIFHGKPSKPITLSNLTPEQLPEINNEGFLNYPISNITDIITRSFGYPCRFFEMSKEFAYDIWKTPIFDQDGNLTHITGCLVDVSSEKEYRQCVLNDLIERGEAYQIDSLNVYYIARYNFEDFSFKVTKEQFTSGK